MYANVGVYVVFAIHKKNGSALFTRVSTWNRTGSECL